MRVLVVHFFRAPAIGQVVEHHLEDFDFRFVNPGAILGI
jgi:hypothetical protein